MNSSWFVLIAVLTVLQGLVSGEYQDTSSSNNIVTGGGSRRRSSGGSIGGGGGGGVFIPIISSDSTQNERGEYQFSYESADGTVRREQGAQDNGQIVQGGYSYTAPDGRAVQITFVADQGGFQPEGNVLPVAPELPYRRVQQFIHK